MSFEENSNYRTAVPMPNQLMHALGRYSIGLLNLVSNIFTIKQRTHLIRILMGCLMAFANGPIAIAKSDNQQIIMEISDALVSMGYENVTIEKCKLVFYRRLDKQIGDIQYFGYRRSINLRLIGTNSKGITKVNQRSISYYLLDYDEDAASVPESSDLILFELFIKQKFGSAFWPFEHPIHHNEFVPPIEFELLLKFPNIGEFNTWTDFSSFGTSTNFDFETDFTYNQPEELEALERSLNRFVESAACR